MKPATRRALDRAVDVTTAVARIGMVLLILFFIGLCFYLWAPAFFFKVLR